MIWKHSSRKVNFDLNRLMKERVCLLDSAINKLNMFYVYKWVYFLMCDVERNHKP